MCFEAHKAVWEADFPKEMKVGQPAKTILSRLADRANENLESWPSQELLSLETGMSLKTVTRSIKSLEQAGLIRKKGHWRGGRKYNTYKVNIQLLHSLRREPLSRSGSGAPASEMLAAASKVAEESSPPITEPESSVDELPTDETECAVDQLPPDEYPRCIDAIRVLRELNAAGYNFYTGPLSWSEWYCCESAIARAELDELIDTELFLTEWAANCAHRFIKAVSLPNIFPETMGGQDGMAVIRHQYERFEAMLSYREGW